MNSLIRDDKHKTGALDWADNRSLYEIILRVLILYLDVKYYLTILKGWINSSPRLIEFRVKFTCWPGHVLDTSGNINGMCALWVHIDLNQIYFNNCSSIKKADSRFLERSRASSRPAPFRKCHQAWNKCRWWQKSFAANSVVWHQSA